MDLFSLIRVPNLTKVKTRSRPRVPADVSDPDPLAFADAPSPHPADVIRGYVFAELNGLVMMNYGVTVAGFDFGGFLLF
nr:hypothetical protein [Tanacetum cinerariifolium]